MTRSIPVGEVRRLGDRAFLIGVADAAAAPGAGGRPDGWPAGGVEVVCGSATVMVPLTEPDVDVVARAAADAARAEVAPPRPRRDAAPARAALVTVPCLRRARPRRGGRARRVSGPTRWSALLTARPVDRGRRGVLAGFRLPRRAARARWSGVPRRPRPRPVVPAGSVALANGHAAVYPTASPGGWQLVGRTGFPLFSPERPPYAVLAPGDRVRFTVAGAGDPVEPEPVAGTAVVRCRRAPAGCSRSWPRAARRVQDGGRRGVAAVGVPGAGPADPVSFALANRLVGNAAGAGALELTGGGTRLRCLGACHVAAVGAAPEVRVDGTAVPAGQVCRWRAGPGARGGPPARRDAAPTCRWPAGSSGRSGSGAAPATS